MGVAMFILIVVIGALSEQHQKPETEKGEHQNGNVVASPRRSRTDDGDGFLTHYYKERRRESNAKASGKKIKLPSRFTRQLQVVPNSKLRTDFSKANVHFRDQLRHYEDDDLLQIKRDGQEGDFALWKELGVLFDGNLSSLGNNVARGSDEEDRAKQKNAMEGGRQRSLFSSHDEEDGFHRVQKYDSGFLAHLAPQGNRFLRIKHEVHKRGPNEMNGVADDDVKKRHHRQGGGYAMSLRQGSGEGQVKSRWGEKDPDSLVMFCK